MPKVVKIEAVVTEALKKKFLKKIKNLTQREVLTDLIKAFVK